MNKLRLVLAEKPSVAQSIAKVLSVTERKDGYLQGGGYIVSWCVGHLVGLADAAAYNEKYGKWRYEDLPILPGPWQYAVNEGRGKQFNSCFYFLIKMLIGNAITPCCPLHCAPGRHCCLVVSRFHILHSRSDIYI